MKTDRPTPPAEQPAKRTRSPMPLAFQAAGRIIQILTALSLTDAEKSLNIVREMFDDRKSFANPPNPAE